MPLSGAGDNKYIHSIPLTPIPCWGSMYLERALSRILAAHLLSLSVHLCLIALAVCFSALLYETPQQ